jgi:arsenate reductase (thioredoxin)
MRLTIFPVKTWLAIILAICFGVESHAQSKKIVFVCEHGSAKSIIAISYFNKIAKERNLSWEAVSRGTTPDAEISAKTKKLLTDDHMPIPAVKPQALAQKDIDEANQVILFYPLPKNLESRDNLEYWLGIDAVNGDFQKLRDDILARLLPLIDSLENK